MKHETQQTSEKSQTIDTAPISDAQRQSIEQEAIKNFLATNKVKVVKENSEYFVNSKDELIRYRNLSETKKYFESNHSEVLKRMLEAEQKQTFTSAEFNTTLVKYLKVE